MCTAFYIMNGEPYDASSWRRHPRRAAPPCRWKGRPRRAPPPRRWKGHDGRCNRAGPTPITRAGPNGRRRLPLAKDAGRGWQRGRPVVDSRIRRQTRRLRPLAGGGGALLHRAFFPARSKQRSVVLCFSLSDAVEGRNSRRAM